MNVDPTPRASRHKKLHPPVALRISANMMTALLRLDPEQHTIVGTTLRQFGDLQLVEFSIDAPNAPDGAVEMLPAYHHNGRPDPVSMTHVTWIDLNGAELAVQQLGPQRAAAGSVVHIAGPDLQVGPQLRQRCGWCGEQLSDYDLERTASPCGPACDKDGCLPEHHRPAMWPVGALVEVDGRGTAWRVEHEDGAPLPANACAQH